MNIASVFISKPQGTWVWVFVNIAFCPLLMAGSPLSSHFLLAGVNLVSSFASALTIPSNSHLPSGAGAIPKSNLSSKSIGGGGSDSSSLPEDKSFGNYNDEEKVIGTNRGMRSDKEKERLRLSLLKQIQSLDHMKCFPKVLCGLSVDSSKNSKDMDSYFVRSYIQLMRSASGNSEDDSREETRLALSDNVNATQDALSVFLLKSGLLKPKHPSQTASSSEEGSDEEGTDSLKTPLEKKNDALKRLLLSKRRLKKGDDELGDPPFRLVPMFHLSNDDGTILRYPLKDKESQSVTSQISSLVSSWAPWVSLSFGKDSSFEHDPFFKRGGGAVSKVYTKTDEQLQQELDKLTMLMTVRDNEMKRKKNKSKLSRPQSIFHRGRGFRDLSAMDEEIKVYSTAVDIGKKLKDTKQCDYLYNGCPVAYEDIIKVIASIRQDLKPSDESVESLSKEIVEYSQRNKITKHKTQNRNPMTQISHTLPNGEKVEINVQLSPKNDGNEDGQPHIKIESPHGDSFVSDEEPENSDNIPLAVAQENPGLNSYEEAGDDDPAISASYELAGEKIENDHRKPTPLHIFNKVSRRKKATTTLPPITSPKYIVSKKKRTTSTVPSTTTATPKKQRRTRRPTSKKPMPSTIKTKPPIRQITANPRITRRPPSLKSSATAFTTMKPRTSKTTRTVTRNTSKPTISTKDNVESSLENTSPISFKLISKIISKGRPAKGSGSDSLGQLTPNSKHASKNKKPSVKRTTTTTTERPIYDDDDVFAPHKLTIEIDKSTHEQVSSEEEETTTTTTTTTTSVPSTTTRTPTTTSTTTTSTAPPNSYFDEVIADMYKTLRPKVRKTTTTTPKTTLVKKRRKPINYFSQHYQGQVFSENLQGNSTTGEATYATSVESGSGGEEHLFSMSQLGDGNVWIQYDNKEQGITNRGPPTDLDTPNLSTDDPDTGTAKKRITYKNPKRPYLVLMKPGVPNRTGSKLKGNRPGQISSSTDMINSEYYTRNNSSMIGTNSDETVPLIIEPGFSDYSHWTP